MNSSEQLQNAIDELATFMVKRAEEDIQMWSDDGQPSEDLCYTPDDFARLMDDIEGALMMSFRKEAKRAKLPLEY